MILLASPLLAVYIILLTVTAGLFFGSAFHCLAWRIAHREAWSKGRSHCPSCGHVLGAADLIPVVSWLSLKGRCRYCKTPISPRYPLAEGGLAMLYLSILLRYDVTTETLCDLVLVTCLFCLSLVDLEILEIPDRFVLIPAVTGVIYTGCSRGWLQGTKALGRGLLIGALLLIFSLVMDKLLGKESMGGGDIKLLAMLGIYFSPLECLLLLFLSAVTGILMAFVWDAKKGTAFPFGPAIALSAWLVLMIGNPVVSWYTSLW